MPVKRSVQGATLIELIISIVIIGISVVGVLLAMRMTSGHSADPMIRHQAIAIAEAYMEEIVLQEYAEPPAPWAACNAGALGADAGEDRASYDDVDDYHGLVANGCDTPGGGACNRFGDPIAGLEAYSVSVVVDCNSLGSIPSANAKQITITVSHPAGSPISLVAFRTRI